ncbi:hypothetical protein E2C01_014317 [Portunus trituberculatus]|uniref:Uncharacterized protein n=1 Tax=Portunus trituberculatus TaxID=210409 RepID=A0A5B7DJK0_PORTR|nr:hypothetical protein [Portunus trituberculatus]
MLATVWGCWGRRQDEPDASLRVALVWVTLREAAGGDKRKGGREATVTRRHTQDTREAVDWEGGVGGVLEGVVTAGKGHGGRTVPGRTERAKELQALRPHTNPPVRKHHHNNYRLGRLYPRVTLLLLLLLAHPLSASTAAAREPEENTVGENFYRAAGHVSIHETLEPSM